MSDKAWPSVVNLANSIVGVSVLAMPYCFKQLGVILGPLLLLLASYITRKSCHFLVKGGSLVKRRSYEHLALHSFGPFGKLAVELCTIGLMLATCVGFFVIIGDLAPVIISKVLNVPNSPSLRVIILVIAAFGVALPLGLLRKLSSLTSLSSLSFCFYFTLILFLFLQALPNLFSDRWSSGPHKIEYWRPAGILKCFPIFGLAFACQTQLFPIYDTMTDPSLKKMIQVIDSAINMVAIIYLSVGFFGIVAFYDTEVAGDILLSFRPSIVGEAIKLGFVLSVAISFPLVIFPCRLSINSLLWPTAKKGIESAAADGVEAAGVSYIPPLRFKAITASIVVCTLIIGINVPGIEAILGLVGSTVGVLISFIFPSTMFLVVSSVSHGEGREKFISKIVFCMGVIIMVSSTYMNLTETGTAPKPVDLESHHQVNQLPLKPASVAPVGVENPAAEVEAPKEVRREPPVPQAPLDTDIEKDSPKEVKGPEDGDKKAGNQPLDPKKPAAGKEDYDNLIKKFDEAEGKHDKLMEQLAKQQEQQKIIMEQQNLIIEQLKEQKKDEEVKPVVAEEVLKTQEKIVETNKVLDNVVKAAINVGEPESELKLTAPIPGEQKAQEVAAPTTLSPEKLAQKAKEAEKLAEDARKKAVEAAKEAKDRAEAAVRMADAKKAAEDAKAKEEEAHQAAEEAVLKVLAAKAAAKAAVDKEVAAKESEKKLKVYTDPPVLATEAPVKASQPAPAEAKVENKAVKMETKSEKHFEGKVVKRNSEETRKESIAETEAKKEEPKVEIDLGKQEALDEAKANVESKMPPAAKITDSNGNPKPLGLNSSKPAKPKPGGLKDTAEEDLRK